MKTAGALTTDFYHIVSNSPIKEAISGKIIRKTRSASSNKEDCVISPLTSVTAQIQDGFVNINIYVPDINSSGGKGEDEERTIPLQNLCVTVFGDKAHPRYDNDKGIIYWIEQQDVRAVNGKDEHVINNKIRYKFNNE